jgi:hypothetical protein
VPIGTSKSFGDPLIVISVLRLAPATVLSASDFLAWTKNHDAGAVGSFEKATSNLFSCKYVSTFVASLSKSIFRLEIRSVFAISRTFYENYLTLMLEKIIS